MSAALLKPQIALPKGELRLLGPLALAIEGRELHRLPRKADALERPIVGITYVLVVRRLRFGDGGHRKVGVDGERSCGRGDARIKFLLSDGVEFVP